MAKRFFSAASFNVFKLDLEVWDYPRHAHNFFELVFIISGHGIHRLNDESFEYVEGDIFLLTPKDEHEFVVKDRTVFGYIKFTEQLFLEKTELVSNPKWRKKLDAVVLHSNNIPGAIVKTKADRESAFQLFGLLLKEFKNPLTYGRSLLLELFGALLIIISRNISTNEVVISLSEKDRVNSMLTYIRQNVLDSEKIKVSKIAEEFSMSFNYVSIFVKKHAGISIQKYVMQTKMKMAQRLLKQTNLTFSEIANKLGFTDSSHFSRTFKKNLGVTPKAFKRSLCHAFDSFASNKN